MKCPVCGTPWTMLDKSPAHPFGGWVTHCSCQHVLPGSPLYPSHAAPRDYDEVPCVWCLRPGREHLGDHSDCPSPGGTVTRYTAQPPAAPRCGCENGRIYDRDGDWRDCPACAPAAPRCERCGGKGYWTDLLDGYKYDCPACATQVKEAP